MNANDRSHGLWEASAPPPPPTPRLNGDVEADVVVVGAGYTGLSAALHLAERGVRVVVLEAVEIGFGGSGRNVGLVNAGMWVMPEALPAELGTRFGTRLIAQLGEAPALVFDLVERHGMDCQAVRAGTLHCAVGRKGLAEIAERARQWQAIGAPVELLDAAETERRVGTSVYAGALLDRRAGTIQPLAYARGLAAAAAAAGAVIHARSSVLAREDLGDRWRLRTEAGSVTAPWIIAATNAYSTENWTAIRTELVRLPYFNLATKPLSDNLRRSILPAGEGVWDTPKLLSSFRFDRDNRLVFGSVGALSGTGARVHHGWGKRALARVFPQLRDTDFDHEWYGSIGMTDNALPRFHMLGRNCFSISGYNGRGIAPGTSFGRDLARLASSEVKPDDLSLPLTRLDRAALRGIKEECYHLGSQVAHVLGARF